MDREGKGQRERQRERQRRGQCGLQEQRRAAGARRHVGHAPELRWEQRGGGLLEALTTLALPHPRPPTPAGDRARTCERGNSKLSKLKLGASSRQWTLVGAQVRSATKVRETKSEEARDYAQGSRECGESDGVRGARVARPACGGGLSGGGRCARGAGRGGRRAHLCTSAPAPRAPLSLRRRRRRRR